MKENPFYQQVELVLRILPFVASEKKFALKGGTAINCFVRDMPRLSVDIDLTYLPLEDRNASLANMSLALEEIAARVRKGIPTAHIDKTILKGTSYLFKLVVQNQNARIKIEPNTTLRGSVFPHETRNLVKRVADKFGLSVSMQTLSVADLYGGKLCAALDRQHPRDLFDVKVLFDNEGLTDQIRKCFVVYLVSHNRPMAELLDPSFQDSSDVFKNEFIGMAQLEVSYDDLVKTRERLKTTIHQALTNEEREFLLSMKLGEPKWNLIDIPGIEKLPAIRWKLQNIQRMDKTKHRQAVEKLKVILKL